MEKSFSMTVNDFNIMRVAVRKTENQTPRAIDRHRPLALPVSCQRMQAHRFERRNVIQRTRNTQDLQSRKGLATSIPLNFDLPSMAKRSVARLPKLTIAWNMLNTET